MPDRRSPAMPYVAWKVSAMVTNGARVSTAVEEMGGHGGESDFVENCRGSSMVLEFHDKVTIEMACSEPNVEATIAAIVFSARTGEVGKIFVQALERVVRIRTGEADVAALTPVTAVETQRKARVKGAV